MSDAKEYTGTQKNAVVISETAYYSNKVTVTGLTENTQYYYQAFKTVIGRMQKNTARNPSPASPSSM